MKRRRHTPADSLDLLLDTICNTFGGIIFIALLVVLLLTVSGRPETEQNQVQHAEEVVLQNQLETLAALKLRLQSSLKGQTETIATLTPDNLKKTLGNYQEETARHANLKSNISAIQEKILLNVKQNEKISTQVNELQSKLEVIQRQSEELKKTLVGQRDSRRETLRMPVVRSAAGKSEVIIILQFNRFYIWHRYSAQGTREGLNTEDFLVLSDETKGTVTAPNPAAGIALDQTDHTRKQIFQKLKQFHPNEYNLAIIVRPDSYGAFKHIREIVTVLKLEYDLQPTTLHTQWVDRGGTGGFVQ